MIRQVQHPREHVVRKQTDVVGEHAEDEPVDKVRDRLRVVPCAALIFGATAATPVAQPRALWERQRIAQAAGLTSGIGRGESGRTDG